MINPSQSLCSTQHRRTTKMHSEIQLFKFWFRWHQPHLQNSSTYKVNLSYGERDAKVIKPLRKLHSQINIESYDWVTRKWNIWTMKWHDESNNEITIKIMANIAKVSLLFGEKIYYIDMLLIDVSCVRRGWIS